MSQIKKKFPFLILLLSFLLIIKTDFAYAQELEGNQSDVVDQKSIIEEQLTTPVINSAFDYNLYIEQKPSPYAAVIKTLTAEERELICKITYREAGNQSIIGQRAVMEVILNRLCSGVWPNDIESVLSAPGQFSTWSSRNKITDEKLAEMQFVLSIVETDNTTILPNNNYVYFNCANPKKDSIKIEEHWFWV